MSVYFDWPNSADRFVRFDTVRAADVNAAFDKVSAGFAEAATDVARTIKIPGTPTPDDQLINLSAAARAGRVLAFDASGNITAISGGFRYLGDWVTATAYLLNDVFRDPTSKNLYVVAIAHTSGVLATDIAAGKAVLAVNVADVDAARILAETAAATATAQAGIATTQAGLATTNGATQVALAAAQVALATTQVGLATTNGASQVALATAEAVIASTQAGLADADRVQTGLDRVQTGLDRIATAGSATTAGTQAGIATTKAAEAAASAASIAGGPVTSVGGATGIVSLKTLNGAALVGTGDITISSLGSGGTTTTITTSLTLTAASVGLQSVTGTQDGAAVVLPAATTLQTGISNFSVHNVGKYSVVIKDSTGKLLGFVEPNSYALCSLSDNTTAAGKWDLLGVSLCGVDISIKVALPAAIGNNANIKIIQVDASRKLLLFNSNTAGLFAVVFDETTRTAGTVVLVRSGAIGPMAFHGILSASNQVLAVSIIGTTLQGVALTLTGTSIAVGTAAAQTVANSPQNLLELLQVGSSFVLSYDAGGTDRGFLALTVTGTTVAIGTVVSFGAASPLPPFQMYVMSSSVILVIGQHGVSIWRATPYTVSGTTLTIGTASGDTSLGGSASAVFLSRQLPSGRIACFYGLDNGSEFVLSGAIITVTGTVAVRTTVAMGTASAATGFNPFIHQVGEQCIVGGVRTTGGSSPFVNVLSHSTGTAVAGTKIDLDSNGALLGMFGYSATELWLCDQSRAMRAIGISGNNPVVNYVSRALPARTNIDSPVLGVTNFTSLPLAGKNKLGDGRVFNGGIQVSAQTLHPQMLVSSGAAPYTLPTHAGLSGTSGLTANFGRESDAAVWTVNQPDVGAGTTAILSRFTVV